ncbi:phage minor tail protein L [Escherichia coli]|nr:phage minor tail protein L [Escherichia coli]
MTLKRACSLLTVKSFSEDERVITGIASTPSPDRDGDILEPEGAEFGSAIPFLWQHDHSRPVGQCTVRRVSEGLEITATLVKPVPDMPSQLAARLDEVWAAIKTGLVRGLSVGFRPHEYTFLVLATPTETDGALFPGRIMLANTCMWTYRSDECGYTGGAVADEFDNPTTDIRKDRCSKCMRGCEMRSMVANFGGFLSINKLSQ